MNDSISSFLGELNKNKKFEGGGGFKKYWIEVSEKRKPAS